jgi:hypothetical protein
LDKDLLELESHINSGFTRTCDDALEIRWSARMS